MGGGERGAEQHPVLFGLTEASGKAIVAVYFCVCCWDGQTDRREVKEGWVSSSCSCSYHGCETSGWLILCTRCWDRTPTAFSSATHSCSPCTLLTSPYSCQHFTAMTVLKYAACCYRIVVMDAIRYPARGWGKLIIADSLKKQSMFWFDHYQHM